MRRALCSSKAHRRWPRRRPVHPATGTRWGCSPFGLLSRLAANDGQPQQRLADTMGVHRNVMVGLVDDLEARGLVQRCRHPTDRRAHAVHLTDVARHVLVQAESAADEQDADLLAALDEPDRARLLTLLQRLSAHTELAPGVHPTLR